MAGNSELKVKKIIIAIAVLLTLALGFFFYSLYYSHKVLNELEIQAVKPPAESGPTTDGRPRTLTPANPEDYGMIVMDQYHKPETQQQWDELISQKVKHIKSQLSKEDLEKMEAKIAEDPAKTAEKIKTIEEKIVKCREILTKEPNNKEIKDKLDRLMILRSISESLPSKQ